MSDTQTTENATNQPIPQYPPAINIGGGSGMGMGGYSPFNNPVNQIVDTINKLRDKVIELEGKVTVLTSLIKK